MKISSLIIDQDSKDQYWLCNPDGSRVFGPYKTAAAAKSERTKFNKL